MGQKFTFASSYDELFYLVRSKDVRNDALSYNGVLEQKDAKIILYSGSTRGSYSFSSNPEVGQKLAFASSYPALFYLVCSKTLRNE
jgi:hypothetical protein